MLRAACSEFHWACEVYHCGLEFADCVDVLLQLRRQDVNVGWLIQGEVDFLHCA